MQRSIKSRHLRLQLPVLPTLLTLGNGICGLASISYAASAVRGSEHDPALFFAGLFIFGAMVFDSLDGAVARWTKQTTKFGAELDSLCDAISFGVAPALVVLQISAAWPPRLLWIMAALFMACTVLRLARFNVETEEERGHASFSGLPSPAAAATLASFVLVVANGVPLMPDAFRGLLPAGFDLTNPLRNVVPLIAVALAGLMVSRIRYPHVVYQALHTRHHFRQLAQIVFALAAIVALGELAAPLILCTFVLMSPARAAWQRFTGQRPASDVPVELPVDLPPEPIAEHAAAEPVPVPVPVTNRLRPPSRLRLWWPPRGKRRKRA
jgi:CDP-diacylglycerol--serine O-phosphatidyltransferase